MYRDWFLDYASYVILERAVPAIEDGLKPVQRRILHAMRSVDDGKYNKVANIVGQTMQYHPHGDASIGDALVQLGQKDLLIDTQGNWGNILTGDGAAAPRYIEARLSKFALDTVFNPKTTHWMLSYDGRKKEPVHLPVKFPLLLAQGVEGIAVGLNSKILPHNFVELCNAALSYLKSEEFTLYPDFPTGGEIDVTNYRDGERGGTIRIRAKIRKEDDNRSLVITEIPYGTTTSKIIETILRANQKGTIKVKKIDDFTAETAKIVVQLAPGSSSDKAIDALYAFTDCEVNISPNCCVIEDRKPVFTNISTLLRKSVDHTRELLRWELQIEESELLEQLFYTSLERIFIENRIYKEPGYEQAPDREKLIAFVDEALIPYKAKLVREVRREDIERLFEIRMIRITRFDSKKADELIRDIKKKLDACRHNLTHLTEYTIAWFEMLRAKYGEDHPRLTEVRNFATVNVKAVVEANLKLYIDREQGFIGTGLRKNEFLCPCSEMDDLIVFHRDGKYRIVHVAEKLFIGTDILHVDIFHRGDDRTTYNVIYRDGKPGGVNYWKRFAVTGVARDKDYDLTQGKPGSRVLYFSVNPNGESEVVRIQLKPMLHLKKDDYLMDFGTLAIKSRTARGNVLTRYEIKSVSFKQKGTSSLGGRQVWFDPDILRLNYDGHGTYLGEFKDDDRILVLMDNGDYYLNSFDLTAHFERGFVRIERFDPDKVWSLAMWNDELKFYYGKRFTLDATPKPQNMLGASAESRICVLTDSPEPQFLVHFTEEFRPDQTIDMNLFIDVKSPKAKGKRISTYPIASIEDISPEPPAPEEPEGEPDEKNEETEINDTTEASEIKVEISAVMPPDSLPKESDNEGQDATQLSLF